MSGPSAYQAALDYIYSFADPLRKPAATPDEAAQNLVRMRALLAALGNPHDSVPCVLVAGTKGKGSTCAMVESMVRAAGYRTGLWTSPHLNTYRERFQIDRQLISRPALVDLLAQACPAIDAFDTATYGKPSVFDVGLALALCYFAAQHVNLAVIEVGLGGRYDATNVLTPLVAAISSISYDHMHVLGSTLAAIADNKAGIIKPGVPAVTVPQADEAATVIAHVADAVGGPLWLAADAGVQRWNAGTILTYPVAPTPQLRGAFQRENARLALGTTLLLRAQGWAIPDAACATGLATVWWPGRLEVASQSPLIVLDGAHNGDSAQKLAAALRSEFASERLVLVLGVSRDKDIDAITAALVPHADALVLTRSTHPRAQADLDWLLAAAQPYVRGSVHVAPSVAHALDTARTLAQPHDLVCVTGSLFIVGAAREALGLTSSD